jgi:hypothetical protein
LLLAVAAGACGSPDPDRKFEFTPVPYVVVDDPAGGTRALALAPGSPTFAERAEAVELVRESTPYISIIDAEGIPRDLTLAETESGLLYRVDEIAVQVAIDGEESFVDWAEEWGFTSKERFRLQTDEFVFLVLAVPPGSAPDALALVRTNGSVVDAWLSNLNFLAG